MWDRYGIRRTLARRPRLRPRRLRWHIRWVLPLMSLLILGLGYTWWVNSSRSGKPQHPQVTRTPQPRSENLFILGVNPTFDLVEVRRVASDVAADLSRLSGLDVRSVVGASYRDLVDGMRQGDVDGAFFSPVAYLRSGLASFSRPTLRILRNPHFQDHYYAVIVAKKGRFRTAGLGAICERRIGYTELDSSSGYIFAKLMFLEYLEKNKGRPCLPRYEAFLGSHKAVLEAVDRGDVDFGAVFGNDTVGKYGAWRQLGNFTLEAISVSQSIPSDGLFIRLSVGEKKSAKIVRAFLDYKATSLGSQRLKRLFGADAFVEADSEDYNDIAGSISRFEKLSQKYAKVGAAE